MAYFAKRKWLYLLAVPAALFFFVYIILPFFIRLYYSFTNYSGFGAFKWMGFGNYERLLKTSLFWRSLSNTMKTAAAVLVFLIPISFGVALLMKATTKGTNVYKTLLFAPVIISSVIAGIIWLFILDPVTGLLNSFLRAIGLNFFALEWIGGLKLSPYSIAVVYIWQQMGYTASLLYAGLQQIPSDLYEAARIDGANRCQIIRNLEIPMLRESFLITYILTLTGSLKIFDTVRMLTNGGPNRASESLLTYLYGTIYTDSQVALGNAIAVNVFIITFGFSLILMKLYSQSDKVKEALK